MFFLKTKTERDSALKICSSHINTPYGPFFFSQLLPLFLSKKMLTCTTRYKLMSRI